MLRITAILGITLVAGAFAGPDGADAQADPPGPWSSADFVWPLSAANQIDLPLTSPFGPRLQGSQNFAYDFHRGIDIAAPVGTPIYAITDGTIRIAGTHQAYSDMLVQLRMVRTGQPYLYANYTHLSDVVVTEGQAVSQGDLLGYTGVSASGFAHLHFEIREGGLYQRHARNPMAFLPYPDTAGHSAAIQILPTSSSDDGLGNDVVVSVAAIKDELDIDSVTLSLHDDQTLTAPPPADTTEVTGWDFSLQELNALQTPIVEGSSDTTILDNPVVTLGSGTSVRIAPGRYDGRNPPWDVATYQFTFRGVPVPDPSAVRFHLAASVGDVRENVVTTWSSPTDPTAFEPNDGLAFHRGVGAQRDLRLAWSGPLDPADVLTGDEIACTPTCTATVTNAEPATGVYELRVDPAIGAQDLVITVAAGALTDATGRPTSLATTTFVLDNWAPEIVGAIDVAPNQAGWVNESAMITWTAIDPAPSSGFAAAQPTPSAVDQLGIQTYTTATLCDALNNCRQGSFTIGFDNISPEITITSGPEPDSIVPPDDVPALACAATDAHSGVDGEGCIVTSTTEVIDENLDRVTAVATATDVAGNEATVAWTFDVGVLVAGPRLVFQAAADELAVLALDADGLETDDVEDILDAIDDLDALDADEYWVDDATVTDESGTRVYRFALTALRSIDQIDNTTTTEAVQSMLDAMRSLATGRIDAAAEIGGDDQLLRRAERRLEVGDALRESERWSRASFYYRFAWYWARQAARAVDDPAAIT